MSRIASYHDLSIYSSYKNNTVTAGHNKNSSTPPPIIPKIKTEEVTLNISEGGKNALKNDAKPSSTFKLSEAESVKRDQEQTSTINAYKSRAVAQQYKQQSKLSTSTGSHIDSEL